MAPGHRHQRFKAVLAGVAAGPPPPSAGAASSAAAAEAETSGSIAVPLDTEENALEIVGGKGRSLSNMTRAGFQVPGGFLVTTAGYRAYVAEHRLHERILQAARPTVVGGRSSFEQSASTIAQLFEDHAMSTEATEQITRAYADLGQQQDHQQQPAVAVRSSATAEDLPGLSFAGQHETFLNVSGAAAVVTAVRDCWASLWTAQAISYRHQNGIPHGAVAMGVVVQRMIPSDVAVRTEH
eukprot:COSAG06_NODE_1832_length_8261_cov_31.690112_6_plen_239_part_00